MKIHASSAFLRKLKEADNTLQEEILEKIDLLKDKRNYERLKVHKLHGKFKKYYSFSVNYKIRIIFIRMENDDIVLSSIGSHEIYE